MHNTDELDNSWDALDAEFGLGADTAKPKPPVDKHTPPPAHTPAVERVHTPIVEDVEWEADADTDAEVETEPTRHSSALFDPGPEHILEDADNIGATSDDGSLDDNDSGELFDTESATEQQSEQEGGGKRKRKRRRRKKKKGPGEGAVEGASELEGVTEATVPDDADADADAVDTVEEGEAPSEIVAEDDEDEDDAPTSAVDEELEAEANLPKQEWSVMTWSELIGKLYRPN